MRNEENEKGKFKALMPIFGSQEADRPRVTQKFVRNANFTHKFSGWKS